MDASNSYLLLKGSSSTFAKEYNVRSIPRYRLIASDGKVLNFDAPHPTDKRIDELIRKHIN
jgi:hypothetical protein